MFAAIPRRVARRASTALIALIACVLTFGAHGALASYDDLNGVSLGDTPYSTGTPFDGIASYFATDFTTTPDERFNAAAVLGCGAWGSKTGWVRFATGVQGNLHIGVDSSYDVIYHVFRVPLSKAPGSASIADLQDVDCFDSRTTPGEDYSFGYAIPAGQTIYVQTAAKCAGTGGGPAYPCSPAQEAAAPSGPTTVRLRFTPTDKDVDGIADDGDSCPTLAGTIGGCPDSDGDGVADPPAGLDCAPTVAAVHPGAIDIPGNAIDEDCAGGPAPYPRLTSVVKPLYGLYRDGVVRPLSFSVLDVVPGLRIEIDCSGRHCPFSVTVKTVKTAVAQFKLGKEFRTKARKLAVGARVTVRLTLPGYVGRRVRYTIRSKRHKPFVSSRCLAAGSRSLVLKRC